MQHSTGSTHMYSDAPAAIGVKSARLLTNGLIIYRETMTEI